MILRQDFPTTELKRLAFQVHSQQQMDFLSLISLHDKARQFHWTEAYLTRVLCLKLQSRKRWSYSQKNPALHCFPRPGDLGLPGQTLHARGGHTRFTCSEIPAPAWNRRQPTWQRNPITEPTPPQLLFSSLCQSLLDKIITYFSLYASRFLAFWTLDVCLVLCHKSFWEWTTPLLNMSNLCFIISYKW